MSSSKGIADIREDSWCSLADIELKYSVSSSIFEIFSSYFISEFSDLGLKGDSKSYFLGFFLALMDVGALTVPDFYILFRFLFSVFSSLDRLSVMELISE